MVDNKHAENGGSDCDSSNWKYGLRWAAKYEIGHDTIDAQHKELFRLTSNLIEACELGSGLEVVGETIDFLTSYTVNHFADEEALMTQNKYPYYKEHKKKHDDFKQTVLELVGRYQESGSTSELYRDVNAIIVRWLITHISHVDRKLAEFMKLVEIQRQQRQRG